MRTPLLVGVVVLVHCVAVGSVVLIQGCGTLPQDPLTDPTMPPQVSSANLMPHLPQEPVYAPVDSSTYVIRKGDSLSKIAKAHGLSTLELSSLNNIKNPNKIRIGQTLILPGAGVSEPAPIIPSKPKIRRTIKADGPVYTVRSGDSLSVIAHAYGVKTADIKDANGLSSNRIVVGQKLTIPGPTKTPKAAPPQIDGPVQRPVQAAPVRDDPPRVVQAAPVAPKGVMKDYKVEDGDDIFSIAMMWGVSVSRIREVNSLLDDELTAGQNIKIPLTE
jgi:peptidoglycan endopeptidase LytF